MAGEKPEATSPTWGPTAMPVVRTRGDAQTGDAPVEHGPVWHRCRGRARNGREPALSRAAPA
jgi:hypothetical protein